MNIGHVSLIQCPLLRLLKIHVCHSGWFFCTLRSKPTVGDVFIGYHDDAAASMTLHVCTTRGLQIELNDPHATLEV